MGFHGHAVFSLGTYSAPVPAILSVVISLCIFQESPVVKVSGELV